MKKNDLTNLKNVVIKILEEQPAARDSDDKLYFEVCKLKNENAVNLTFSEIMLHRNEYNLPAYSSVERARRKAQAERKDLIGTVKELRQNLEPEYVSFAFS